jgi:hypothetical protein
MATQYKPKWDALNEDEKDKAWATSTNEMNRQLKKLAMMEAHEMQIRGVNYFEDKKKMHAIWERNNYRVDRHIFIMNFAAFGAQGLCSAHKKAMKFYNAKMNEKVNQKKPKLFWKNLGAKTSVDSDPDDEWP